MTENEAIRRANAHLLQVRGIELPPVEVRFVQRAGSPAYWWISYGTAVYFPEDTAAGATIDGGECILFVDDESGDVSEA